MTEREQQQIFDEWLNQHKGILFKIVRAYAFTELDQEDLFQEIALQVWRSIPNFRGESKVSTWIYRIALFRAATWVRAEKRRPPTQSLSDVAHVLRAQTQDRDERVEWLYAQIAQMETVDRGVCLLLLDGFSYREIADLIGISTGNVGVRIHRIKKRLVQRSREVNQHGV